MRLAFHDCGEFLQNDPDSLGLGCDGCLSISSENAGLIEATSIVRTVIAPIYATVCDRMSQADFVVFFAQLALEASEPTLNYAGQNGGQGLTFDFGRQDALSCNVPRTRMPSVQLSSSGTASFFVDNLGLDLLQRPTTTESFWAPGALLGAHTIGRVHPANSGYGFAEVTDDFSFIRNAWVRITLRTFLHACLLIFFVPSPLISTFHE